jgi:GT2 family glycosyltransferase
MPEGADARVSSVVLDNASTDGSVDELELRWPDFRLVRFERNLGFSLANNRGARLARGHWLVFLNNDAFPRPDWLERLLEATLAWPDFSFFASRLVYAGNPNQVQSAGDVCNISGFAWSRGNGFPVAQEYLEFTEVFSPCGAAAMYSRQAFLEVGGFNEDFISHLEDVDLGFRLRLIGQRCLYVPTAVVDHVVSAGYGVESDRTVYQVQRNVIWMYLSDMPGSLFWKYLPAHLLANLVFLVTTRWPGACRLAHKRARCVAACCHAAA